MMNCATQNKKMNSSISLAIFIHLLITATVFTNAQEGCSLKADYCWNCNSKVENYTSSTTFKKNLNTLLKSISSDTRNNYGFYNSSLGKFKNRVNVIALCRGDISKAKCHSCLNETSYRLLERCPNKKEAIIWDEQCMVRYSNNTNIFDKRQDVPLKSFSSPNSAADAEQFKKVLNPLLDGLIVKAASGSSTSKFAFGNDKVPDAEPIFALVQCTPDLNQDECRDCLQDSVLKIPECCGGKQGGRVLKPSCNLRFEPGKFYDTLRPAICSNDVKYCWGCAENGSSNTSTIFKKNLNTLLFSQLSHPKSKTKDFGFYTSSMGKSPDRVNGLAMCRGDVELEICHKCINESSQALLEQFCPDKMEGIIWAERCMVRYSNRIIFSLMEGEPVVRAPSLDNVSDPNLFKQVLNALLDRLITKASSGDLRKKFSTGNGTIPGFETIYGLTQCTPDISKQQCSECLQETAKLLPECCDGVIGARILKPSCSLWYEIHRFYN